MGTNNSNAVIKRTFLPLSQTVTLNDDGSTGHASLLLFEFPVGNIEILGVVLDVQLSSAGITTLNANTSVGTTATADSSLASTDSNLVASTASNFTAGEAVAQNGSTAVNVFNGSGSNPRVNAYLNIGATGDPTGNQTVKVVGRAIITWIDLGSY